MLPVQSYLHEYSIKLKKPDGSLIPSNHDLKGLMSHPAFSALCCIHGDKIVLEASSDDFSTTRPHSIQSISKLHVHLIVGRLIEQGLLSLEIKALAQSNDQQLSEHEVLKLTE